MSAVAIRTLREHYHRAGIEALAATDPAWLREIRLAAWEHFEAKSGDEEAGGARWLSELKKAASWGLEAPSASAFPAAFKPTLSEGDWGELSGSYAYGCREDEGFLLSEEAKKAGVVFCSLRSALKSHEALVRAHLFSRTTATETSWAALNAANFGQGAFLLVPKNVKLIQPLRSVAVHDGGQPGFFPRTLAILEEGSEATLVDELHSGSEAPGFVAGASELIVGRNARLSYIHFQNLNRQSGASLRQTTELERDAYLYTLGILHGSAWTSSYIGSKLKGEGANVDLLGLLLANGKQKLEVRTLQDHLARGGNSDALVKTILRGQARAWFDGVVRITKGGQNSNAFQSNPNLLLSEDAKAESIPTLEIEADDVACKHAASIGSIDEEEKFYLLSRGINPADTEAMIVEGFAAELAQRLPHEQLQERFVAILNRLAIGGAA